MNAKADNMRKTIVDILGEDIGKVDFLGGIYGSWFISYGQTTPIKVDAFRPRTCVKFHVENLEENGYSEITYEADPIQFRDRIIYSKKISWSYCSLYN